MAGSTWEDELSSTEAREGVAGASRVAHIMLITIVMFFVCFIAWAYNATLEEVTRGEGRIIASSQTQVVQHLEGGILQDLLVREGQIVEKNQVLMRIENKIAEAELAEKRKRYISLLATAARLRAETTGSDTIEYPKIVLDRAPDVAASERQLFLRRQEQLEQQIQILRDQKRQKVQELQELLGRTDSLKRQLLIAQEEIELIEPLVQSGASSRLDLIRARQKIEDLESQIGATQLSVPRTRTAISEADRRIEEKQFSFRAEGQQELNTAVAEANRLEEEITAGVDRVTRTEIRSPVRGTVNKVLLNTIGGVVRPGDDLVEIVPLGDALLVEARIRPADRAQLWPGLPAVVKLSAYDYSIYGGLDAQLIDISADTITDEQGETFYRIRLRTDQTSLGEDKPIIPGMTASVDILTGEKTVLQYLMKPILKAKQNALRER